MNADKLVQMANRIGQFFSAMPDHEEAVEGVAAHLRNFWEPRMRRQLYARLDRTEGPNGAGPRDVEDIALHPLVYEAVQRFRASLEPSAPGATA